MIRYLLPSEGNFYTANLHCHSTESDGHFTPDELLRMDWLCDNIDGTIPPFEEVLPFAQPMLRELGVYKDTIPPEKEEEDML